MSPNTDGIERQTDKSLVDAAFLDFSRKVKLRGDRCNKSWLKILKCESYQMDITGIPWDR